MRGQEREGTNSMRQWILGSHTPPCHMRMVITTEFEGTTGGGGGHTARGSPTALGHKGDTPPKKRAHPPCQHPPYTCPLCTHRTPQSPRQQGPPSPAGPAATAAATAEAVETGADTAIAPPRTAAPTASPTAP